MKKLLEALKSGDISVDEAVMKIKTKPFEDLGYAKPDFQRKLRKGSCEVIYGEGKNADQIAGILYAMLSGEQSPILITRLSEEKAEAVRAAGVDIEYFKSARMGISGEIPEPDGIGRILVVSGGTSDLPVAEEAALTAEVLGNEVIRIYDAGVAGIHRLLSYMEDIMSASVIIAVAGMEGALASVVAGLAECPVIAVPTSVGYGASFGGLSALLSMLNSCASGVTVVNIDNGFGAGYAASQINHMEVLK